MNPSDAKATVVGGRYLLERSIGRGGMGTVWRGRDQLLDREVAVKEVRFPAEVGRQEQDELRERTLREARTTARLTHPNVVTTYDVVEEDGRPWIVMELLDARSLSEELRENGPLPPHRVAELGLALLGALDASHRQGIVHRDVKPGNVLLTGDGRPVLTDFGIATAAGDPSLTSTGVVLGSPAYMSPERARGQRPGPEADLWSLGATLYAAAEGRPPYDGDNALGTLTAVISDPVDPPTVSGPLAEAILGLLEKDPADRLTIEQTRALLTKAAADRSTAATPAPAAAAVALDRASRTEALPVEADAAPAAPLATPPPPPPARRRGLLFLAGALGLALLAAVTAAALMTEGGGDPQKSAKDPSPTPSTSSSTTPSSTAPTTSASSPSPTRDDGVPAGYRLYRDPTGFTVAVPAGWQESRDGTRVDFRDPEDGSRFLRFDQTDQPKDDPKKDWEKQEKAFRETHDNYERIRLEDVDYRDFDAADWEFTFGANTHVLDRGFVAGDRGYAIYVSSSESGWADTQQVFETAADSFRPAGD